MQYCSQPVEVPTMPSIGCATDSTWACHPDHLAAMGPFSHGASSVNSLEADGQMREEDSPFLKWEFISFF